MAASDSISLPKCNNCDKATNKLCSGCRKVYYCSFECQKEGWKTHKITCRKYKKSKAKKNSFASNFKKGLKKEQIKMITVKIKIDSIVNGIVRMKVLNDAFLNQKEIILYQLDYKYKHDAIWKSVYFSSKTVNRQGYKWMRIPISLNKYKMLYRIRAKFEQQSNDKWYPFGKINTVEIASSLIAMPFKVCDIVKYKPLNNYYTSGLAQVIEIIDDYHLKLQDLNDKQEYTIHSNRVVHQTVCPAYLTDISTPKHDEWLIDNRLILKQNDNNKDYVLNVYQSLCDVYKQFARLYGDKLIFMHRLIDTEQNLQDVGKYFARNIIQYIHPSQFNWKISCKLDTNHGVLHFNEMRAYHIFHSMESIKQGFGKEENVDDSFNICDLCHVQMNKFELVYYCKTNLAESHDFCLKCVNIMITQHHTLQQLLLDILQYESYDNIPMDCVEMIVHFVVGTIIKTFK